VSLVSTVVDPILNLHGPPAYALVGGLAFSEAALFVGFVLPGETAVLLGAYWLTASKCRWWPWPRSRW
jgi:membrane protein DedA with SNARE-associated domain